MQEVADRLGRRSLVIVVSDFFAPVATLREGLARMRHDRHETMLLQVLDRDEVEFPFRKWSRFRGLEGERRSCASRRWCARCTSTTSARTAASWRKPRRTLGAEFHSFVTDKPLIDSITQFLQAQTRAEPVEQLATPSSDSGDSSS